MLGGRTSDLEKCVAQTTSDSSASTSSSSSSSSSSDSSSSSNSHRSNSLASLGDLIDVDLLDDSPVPIQVLQEDPGVILSSGDDS